jgi:hypothetical protein
MRGPVQASAVFQTHKQQQAGLLPLILMVEMATEAEAAAIVEHLPHHCESRPPAWQPPPWPLLLMARQEAAAAIWKRGTGSTAR